MLRMMHAIAQKAVFELVVVVNSRMLWLSAVLIAAATTAPAAESGALCLFGAEPEMLWQHQTLLSACTMLDPGGTEWLCTIRWLQASAPGICAKQSGKKHLRVRGLFIVHLEFCLSLQASLPQHLSKHLL